MEEYERATRQRWINSEVAKAKADVGRKASERLRAYNLAMRMLPHVEAARAELTAKALDPDDARISDSAIARALTAAAKLDPSLRPQRGEQWGHKGVRYVLFRADELLIAHAVFECRTRMTARALSADFAKPLDVVHELEREYLDIIADALDLGHRMRGERTRTREELMREARDEALAVAAKQRATKPISMAARERLWDGFAPIERKVFQ